MRPRGSGGLPLAETFTMICHLEAPRPSRRRRGRIALAAFLAVLASLASLIDAVAADNALAPVVVTATREPEAIGRSTADIVRIDADAIRNAGADSVEDLIRRVAGIQVVRNGGPGQSSGFFVRGSGTVRVGFTPAPGHRIGVHVLETRLKAQYDSTEPPFFDDPSPDFRNRLVTRVASLDYRGKPASAWTTTLQASRAADDLTSGGNIQSRFITRRDQATWQNALALAAGQQLLVAYEHVEERATTDA